MAVPNNAGTVMMSLRIKEDTKNCTKKLAELLGQETGTRYSMTQAIEIAVNETYSRHLRQASRVRGSNDSAAVQDDG